MYRVWAVQVVGLRVQKAKYRLTSVLRPCLHGMKNGKCDDLKISCKKENHFQTFIQLKTTVLSGYSTLI